MAVPTLDLSLAESDRAEAARQLVNALEDPGFLYLKNVKGYDPGRLAARYSATHHFIRGIRIGEPLKRRNGHYVIIFIIILLW